MHVLLSGLPVVTDGVDQVIACPVCGDTSVRPTAVACLPAGEFSGEVRIDMRHSSVEMQPIAEAVVAFAPELELDAHAAPIGLSIRVPQHAARIDHELDAQGGKEEAIWSN